MLYYVYSLYCAQASGHVHNVFQRKKRGVRACVDVLGAPCSGLKVLLCQLFLLLLLFLGLWSVVRRRDMGRVSSLFATAAVRDRVRVCITGMPVNPFFGLGNEHAKSDQTPRGKHIRLMSTFVTTRTYVVRAKHTRTHCGRRTYAS